MKIDSDPVFQKIVSGGQTGVDRAALDVAQRLKLPCGGWCPEGRKAEDGSLASSYTLIETPTADYAQRTKWNVRDSDGTLVLTRGRPSEGTAFTIEAAKRLGKPCLVLDLLDRPSPDTVREWANAHAVRVLNVAGPRESRCPGIYEEASSFLTKLFA
jgi:putative molybdenum carrier protein